LAKDVAALASGYPGLTRLVKATAGTYIGNNVAAIADYAEESIKICGVTWPALRKAGRLELVSH
jgi:hypothetical protein